MKTIIAGSRNITDQIIVDRAVFLSGFQRDITEVVCGMATGVDLLGQQWAINHNIPVKEMPANWYKYGRAAGHKRNWEMAEYADALIAVWDGESPGTRSMIKYAKELRLQVYVHYV